MQIISFLSHYQLVYISFDISSFSLISYITIRVILACNKRQITRQSASYYFSLYSCWINVIYVIESS